MAKARIKRYQSGGKVKHYVTGGTAGDDETDDETNPTPPVSSTPPRTTPVVSGTRATPMTGPQVAAARNVRAARTLPATNPATALKTPSPPFGSTGAPTSSVGGNTAVINTPYGPAKQPVIDPMANARALDAGASQTSTGYGSGAAPVGSVRSGPTPSGGFASSGPTKPIEPTQPAGQTAIAGPNIRRPGFVYGGRVANNTIPKKVGMQRPMPFMHGGKVKMMSQPGRVRKMQDGGRADLLADADNSFYGGGNNPKPSPTPTLKPGFLNKVKGVAKAIADRTVNGFQDGGRVPNPQAPDLDEAFPEKEPSPSSAPTPSPRPGSTAPRPGSRAFPPAGNFAANNRLETFRRGGRVRPVPRKMQDGGKVSDPPMKAHFFGGPHVYTPTENNPGEYWETPSSKGFQQRIDQQTGRSDTASPTPTPKRFGGPIRKMQDGGMARIDEAARDTQTQTSVPPRYQFASGGKLPPDNVPAMLGKGEVVLNKNQQKRVAVKPGWQNGLNPKEKSAMSEMRLPRMRKQHAMTGKSVPRIFGGK